MKRETSITLAMYVVSIFLGVYLGSGQSAAIHIMFLMTTCFATFMTRRKAGDTLTNVTPLPHLSSLSESTTHLLITDHTDVVVQAS